jgi:hypothetical protein
LNTAVDDDIRGPVDDRDVAVLVETSDVPALEPPSTNFFSRQFGIRNTLS